MAMNVPPASWSSRETLCDAEVEALRSECESLRAERDEQRTVIADLEEVGTRLQRELSTATRSLDSEQRNRRDAERIHVEVEESLEASVCQLRSQLDAAEADRARLKSKLQELREQLWQRDEALDGFLRQQGTSGPPHPHQQHVDPAATYETERTTATESGGRSPVERDPPSSAGYGPATSTSGDVGDAAKPPLLPPRPSAPVSANASVPQTPTTTVAGGGGDPNGGGGFRAGDWRRTPPVTAPPPPPWRPEVTLQQHLPAAVWAHVFKALDNPAAPEPTVQLRATSIRGVVGFDEAVVSGFIACAGRSRRVTVVEPFPHAPPSESAPLPSMASSLATEADATSPPCCAVVSPPQPHKQQQSHHWYPFVAQKIILAKHWDGLLARGNGKTTVRVELATPGGLKIKSVRATAVDFHCATESTAAMAQMATTMGPLAIGDRVLYRCRSITRIDLSAPLDPAIRSLGQYFLSDCAALKSVSLAGLVHIETVGHRFLADCTSLKRVDLDGLRSVTAAGDGFFFGCSSLVSLDLRPLSRLQRVGHQCLASCMALQHVDFPRTRLLTSVGSDLLDSCSYLASFDATGLSELRTIASNLLYMCADIKTFDFKPFALVSTVGRGCLSGCSKLTHVDTSGGLGNVGYLGDGFLAGCRSLRSVDLSGLTSVQRIGQRFLSGCAALEAVNLGCLATVVDIGADFCSYCPRIRAADFSRLTSLTHIGEGCLVECSSLASLNFSACTAVRHVGSNFLSRCGALQVVDIAAFANVEEVRPGFLSGCVKLHTVRFGDDFGRNVKIVRQGFLAGCSKLGTVNLSSFGKVTVFEPQRLVADIRRAAPSASPPTIITDAASQAVVDAISNGRESA